MGAAILRAVGDSKRPLYFLVASCLTNIALDLLFVVCFHMEVAGAALATIMSKLWNALQCIVCGQLLFLNPFTGEWSYDQSGAEKIPHIVLKNQDRTGAALL